MQRKQPLAAIGLFLVLPVILSSIFYAFIIATGHVGGGNGAYELGLMWSPAVAALLACRIRGLSIQALGWQWGASRWQVLAFATPLAYTAIAYAVVWLAGFGAFPDHKFVDATRSSLGWSGAADWLVIGGYFLLVSSAGITAVRARGDGASERLRELTGGFGAHAVLECVGSEEAMRTAMAIVRAGGAVGRVGVPHYQGIPGAGDKMFFDNVTVTGGPAPVRAYIEELLPDILEGRIEPGRVFDRVIALDQVPDGYRAMNERKSLKVMIKP
jgi:hypothetical protein